MAVPIVKIDIERSFHDRADGEDKNIPYYSLEMNANETLTIRLPDGESLSLNKLEAGVLIDAIQSLFRRYS